GFILFGIFFIDPEDYDLFNVHVTTMAQLFLLFWMSSYVLKDERFARTVLIVFLIGTSLFATLLNIPGVGIVREGRVTGLGDNPNGVASNMVLALLIILGLFIYAPSKHSLANFFSLILAVPLFAVLIGTESRGPILALVAGCIIYWLPHARARWFLSCLFGI